MRELPEDRVLQGPGSSQRGTSAHPGAKRVGSGPGASELAGSGPGARELAGSGPGAREPTEQIQRWGACRVDLGAASLWVDPGTSELAGSEAREPTEHIQRWGTCWMEPGASEHTGWIQGPGSLQGQVQGPGSQQNTPTGGEPVG